MHFVSVWSWVRSPPGASESSLPPSQEARSRPACHLQCRWVKCNFPASPRLGISALRAPLGGGRGSGRRERHARDNRSAGEGQPRQRKGRRLHGEQVGGDEATRWAARMGARGGGRKGGGRGSCCRSGARGPGKRREQDARTGRTRGKGRAWAAQVGRKGLSDERGS